MPLTIVATNSVTMSRAEYKRSLDEVGILRNPALAEAIEDSDKAKSKGVKTWKLKV